MYRKKKNAWEVALCLLRNERKYIEMNIFFMSGTKLSEFTIFCESIAR